MKLAQVNSDKSSLKFCVSMSLMHGHPTIDDENEGAGGTTTIPFRVIISSQLGMRLIGPGHGKIMGSVTHMVF